jgi:DNA-directed RNA polymerase subunit M/transcription elongation factor TFIIS
MARINTVKSAQQRYRTVPVLDEAGQPKSTPVLRKDGTPKTTKTGRAITRRVTVADKTQPLPNHTCGKCGVEIEVGHPYRWVQIKSGPYGGRTMYRCMSCPSWRQSELTSSKMAGIYAAQEHLSDIIDSLETVDDLTDAAQTFADAVREVGEEYRESQSNMVDGFGHDTSMSDELGEKADMLDDWANDIEYLDFEDFDEEPPEEDDFEDEDAFETAKEDWNANADAHWEDQRAVLIDASDECPL